jgi:hypothetical protein
LLARTNAICPTITNQSQSRFSADFTDKNGSLISCRTKNDRLDLAFGSVLLAEIPEGHELLAMQI